MPSKGEMNMKPYIHKVNYYETDKMGITHHSNYIRFMEEARLDYMAQLGFGWDKMEALGISSPVVALECSYKKATTFPDEIEITVKVEKVSAFKLVVGYEMRTGKNVVFTGTSTHCFLGTSGKPVMLEKEQPEMWQALKLNEESL